MPSLSNDNADRITLFLGAGASHFAGYFTFRNFDSLLLEPYVRINNNLPEIDQDTQRFLVEVRQALRDLSRPTTHDNYLWLLNNYKDFCIKFKTHAGVRSRFDRISSQISPFSDIVKHVTDEIVHTTIRHYGAAPTLPTYSDLVRGFYIQLAHLNSPSSPHLKLFTTNYDLLLEALLGGAPKARGTLPLITGIADWTQDGGAWDSKAFLGQPVGFHLLRLHGCVSWFYRGLSDPHVYHHRTPSFLDWQSNLCAMFPGREIYPGKDPHGFAFRALHHAFLTSKLLVFIGFSFRDDDVVHSLLAANAARSRPPRIIVVDPQFTEADLFRSLEESTTRMTLPYLIPSPSQLRLYALKFGEPGSCESILTIVNNEVNNGQI